MALPKVKERIEAGRGEENVREGLAQTGYQRKASLRRCDLKSPTKTGQPTRERKIYKLKVDGEICLLIKLCFKISKTQFHSSFLF